uniref:NodB homology domain-containing protein n=1 Tax=Psilocybe cubensis TaxID=181762 RepID=A0A8H7XY41_PSICU
MLSSLLVTLSLAVSFVVAAPAVGNSTLVERQGFAQVVTKCTVPKTVALTFDDGPYVYLYDISKALVAAGAKGTFFFNGQNWGPCIYDPDQAKRVLYAYQKGHQVASHTWSHAHLNTLTFDQLHHQFWLVEEALMKITGAYPAWARPPYGEYNDLVRQVAGSRGQNLALWDFDSGDTWGISTAEVLRRYDNLISSRPNTVLTLNHEVHQQAAQVVLPYAIKALQAAGYRLVTLAECLGMPAYQWVGEPHARDVRV